MTTRIYKDFTFEAAHVLPSAPAGHPNARVHGHSFHVRVVIAGEPDPETGLVMHFDDLSAAIARVRETLDHRLLNDVPGLSTPSLERIAGWIWTELEAYVPHLAEVHISRPTCQEGCIYIGPSGSRHD
jgi:6-pyruvoyltetrahydropterin/6-carboxytetrahydropterin synthase